MARVCVGLGEKLCVFAMLSPIIIRDGGETEKEREKEIGRVEEWR